MDFEPLPTSQAARSVGFQDQFYKFKKKKSMEVIFSSFRIIWGEKINADVVVSRFSGK